MRIAVVSDTHSRYATVEKAVERIAELKVERVLHCGDIEDSDVVWMFPAGTHFVYGNCDGTSRHSLQRAAADAGMTFHEPYGRLELAGKKVAFIHSDDARLFRQLELANEYDYLFYGHTHRAEERRTGRTRVINPGALHRADPKTFLVVDLISGEIESVVVE